MADDKKQKMSLSQVQSGFAGKERQRQVKSMQELVSALKENTQANKEAKELSDTSLELESFFEKFKGEFNDLENQFIQAKNILSDPKAPEAEKQLANEQIEAIKENAQSEEERREQQKKEDEANSFLAQIAETSEKTASGLSDFMSNAFAAGGLLATAMLFIDPEAFINTLRSAIEGITAIINSISSFISGDFEEGFQTLENNLGSVLGILTAGVLVLLPTIINLVGKTASAFRSVGTFFKNFSGAKGLGGIQKILGTVGKLVGRIFAPLIAIFFAIKGIYEGFQTEGTIVEKLQAGFKEAITGFTAFILDLPKLLLQGIFKLFGEDDAAQAVADFDTKEFLGGIYDKITGFIGNMASSILGFFNFNMNDFDTSSVLGFVSSLAAAPLNFLKGIVSGILGFFGADELSSTVSEFSFTDIIKNLANLIWDTLKNIVGWFADIVTGETSFGDTITNISSVISEFIKGVLRAGLPDPSQPWYSVQGAAAALIPDAVYEYAGIDPETGERMSTPEMDSGSNLGEGVLPTSQDNALAANANAGGQTITSINQNNTPINNTSSTVVMDYTPISPTSGDLALANNSNR